MLSPTTLLFSVFALVLGERPLRTGIWFFLGAFGATVIVGVIAAFLLGDAAAPPASSETPPTWVAVFDVAAGALLLVFVVRVLRRPRDPKRTADAIEKMSKLASSPAIAIVGAGATLANPGGFIPIALKEISQLDPSTSAYVTYWIAFTVVALLPLLAAIVALCIAPDWTTGELRRARDWLERHARTLGAVLVVLVAAALLRDGLVALTS
jgi:threonine/homoserine/homoserine lactone efflux protein